MTITNVGIEDGSQYGNFGSYECHAFAKNESTPKRHGFSISVITSKLLHLWKIVGEFTKSRSRN